MLKPGARAILLFSNTNDAVWEALQNAITSAGLEVESTGVLDKVHRSIKGIQADLGKEKVTRLDLMLTLKCCQTQRSKKDKPRAQPLKDEIRLEVQGYLASVGGDGAAVDQIFSHILQVFLSKNRSVRGINLELIHEICEAVGKQRSNNHWHLNRSLDSEEKPRPPLSHSLGETKYWMAPSAEV